MDHIVHTIMKKYDLHKKDYRTLKLRQPEVDYTGSALLLIGLDFLFFFLYFGGSEWIPFLAPFTSWNRHFGVTESGPQTDLRTGLKINYFLGG